MTVTNTPPPSGYPTTVTQYSSPGVQPGTGVNGPPAVGQGVSNNVETGSLSGPGAAGEMSYSAASLNGSNWDALLDSVQAANLSVSVTAIMVMLVEIMAQMKQDAREDAFAQAQTSLAAGELAAQEMRDAAEDTLTAAKWQAGAQIVAGVATAAAGTVQLGGALKHNNLGSAYGNSAVGARYAAGGAIAKGLSEVISASGSLVAAGYTYDAAMDTADSQMAKADAEYQQALGQAAQQFMQQVADAIKAFLTTMQSVDQAQHKAMGAIYNC